MMLELNEISGVDPEEENQNTDSSPLDLKPEFCQYHDEGCRHAPSCLECPFTRCLYDEKRGGNRRRKQLRDQKIVKLYAAGKKAKKLASRFKLTERTIERIIKENESGKRSLNG
jgi:hypothetical protein